MPTTLITKTGKTAQDFTIPEKIKNDTALIQLILQSESMKDEERQYWFNLTEVMNVEQIEKLRGILTREKEKLAEIDAKYGKVEEDPAVAAKRAQDAAARRASEQAQLKAKEREQEASEKAQEEAALADLANL
ncbi:hypothetical protein K9L27_03490 [Candidatus Gracilibacteria bacterium]|nr:hypothetical protein [Candidatus Gracilibacteria bacterium]